MSDTHKIFISHASADKELADEVVDFLSLGLNLQSTDFFCTSLEGLGIPSGENFIDFIQDKLNKSMVMISLLSPNYYQSVFCVCELGASWITSKAHIPIVVPPITYKDIKDILNADQLRIVDKDSDWDEIRDELNDELNLTVKSARWTRKKEAFLKKLPSVLRNSPKPNIVSSAAYNELAAKYDDATDEIEEMEKTQQLYLNKIKDLEKCKDVEEVKLVRAKYSSLKDEFDQKVKKCNSLLEKNIRVVNEALFYHFRKEELPVPEPMDRDRYDDVKNALEYEKLDGNLGDGFNEGHIEISTEDPQNEKAINSLEQLRELVDRITDREADDYEDKYQNFDEDFRDKHNFNLSFTSRKFWEEILDM